MYKELANVPQLDIARQWTYKSDLVANELASKAERINTSITALFNAQLRGNILIPSRN